MATICAAVLVAIVMIEGVHPKYSVLSRFELERRSKSGDKTAVVTAWRQELLPDILSLQKTILAVLLVVFVVLSVAAFGWFFGIIAALIVALEYGAIARVPLWRQSAQGLYERHEPRLLRFVERFGGVLRLVRRGAADAPQSSRPSSRAELQHLVAQSGNLLSIEEKKLIQHGLIFEAQKVREIMTLRGEIDSIDKKELLGPLVLDDLHKTGHSRFPVTDGDIDHVVGMLYIHNFLTLDSKRSATAGKAMEQRVFYVREDQTLPSVLAAFIHTHHYLFIVVNEYRETVGIVSLEDVIEALLGRKIIDKFDTTHEDLRLVAMDSSSEES